MSVGIGIIGMGWMGQIHAKLAATIDKCRLLAVCDRDQNKLESMKRMLQVDAYTDHRALLDRRDIDAVYLVTPPHGAPSDHQGLRGCRQGHTL